jgi:hypothetical protein
LTGVACKVGEGALLQRAEHVGTSGFVIFECFRVWEALCDCRGFDTSEGQVCKPVRVRQGDYSSTNFDEKEVVRVPAAGFFLPGDVSGGFPLRVDGIGGDDRVPQVNGVQQLSGLGGLGGLVRDPVLRDDGLLFLQHRGEQLDRPVCDAAQPFSVDRDRSEQPVEAAGGRQAAQPAADQVIGGARNGGSSSPSATLGQTTLSTGSSTSTPACASASRIRPSQE